MATQPAARQRLIDAMRARTCFCGADSCQNAEEYVDAFARELAAAVPAADRAALMRAHVALAEQAGRSQAALARIRALHSPAECVNVRCKLKQWCIGCDPDGIEGCDENPWPCPTIRALDGVESAVVDRVAAETPPAETQTAAVFLSTPCDACRHTLNWHRNDVGCTVALCVCGRFQPPAEDGARP